jgi:resorcinol 4-hydroxylase (FADH2)
MDDVKILAPDSATTAETLIARARALAPVLRSRAAATEAARRIPPETFADLRAAGLFRIFQPARYGGLDLDLENLVHITYELGQGCGSAAWVYSVVTFHQMHIALFDRRAQDEVWGTNREALSASSYLPAGTATPAAGGFRLNGTWPFASGIDNLEWIIIGARVAGEAGAAPDFRFCLVPKTDLVLDDNWRVMGLCGTGSKNVVLNDVFVPEHRTLRFSAAREANTPGGALHDHPLYRLPFFAIASYCLIGPGLAIAAGALADYIAEMKVREGTGSLAGAAAKVSQFVQVQMRVSEASGLIDAARLLVLRDCRESMALIRAGENLPIEARLRNKRDQALAMRFLKDAVQLLTDASGARGQFTDHPIQRAYRDIHAVSCHITLNWDAVMPAYGRHMLGLDPGIVV